MDFNKSIIKLSEILLILSISAFVSSCNGSHKPKTYEEIYGSSKDTLQATVDSVPEGHSSSHAKTMTNDEYCQSISSNGEETAIFKAEVTDNNILVIGVDRTGNANFDVFCQQQLEDAWSHGVRVNACFAVDIKDCEFQDGAVVGERIGKAFK